MFFKRTPYSAIAAAADLFPVYLLCTDGLSVVEFGTFWPRDFRVFRLESETMMFRNYSSFEESADRRCRPIFPM